MEAPLVGSQPMSPAEPAESAGPAHQPGIDPEELERRRQIRELRDPKDIRALAHPTRLALLEALGLHGELTATEAAAIVGESPSSCSFHLRTLAKHGFVEETGGGSGRQRPWRIAHLGTSIPSFEDAERSVAADALGSMYVDRQLERFRQWRARRLEAPAEWRRASTVTEMVSWVTPEELKELNDDAREAIDKYRDRMLDPSLRPEGSRPVELLYFSYPVDEWDRAPDRSGSGGDS
jgi:DNA-binding transcriptional ArsR family regulator